MDPLSITTALLAFIEIGVRIKQVVNKAGANAELIQDLLDEVLADLESLKDFTMRHREELLASKELRRSLEQIGSQLDRIHSRCRLQASSCKRLNRNMVTRLKTALRVWHDADCVQHDVTRLKEMLQSTLLRVHLFIAARSELGISRTERNILVFQSEVRTHMHRFDAAFNDHLCGPDAWSSSSTILGHQELDAVDKRYLSYKGVSIFEAIQTVRIHQIVDEWTPLPCFTAYGTVKEERPQRVLDVMMSMAEACHAVRAFQSGHPTTRDTLALTYLMRYSDLTDHLPCCTTAQCIRRQVRDFVERALRAAIRVSDDMVLWIMLYFPIPWRVNCDSDRTSIKRQKQVVCICRKLLSRRLTVGGPYSPTFYLGRLTTALGHLATYHERKGNSDEVLRTITELIHCVFSDNAMSTEEYAPASPTWIQDVLPGDFLPANTSFAFMNDARVVQSHAAVLAGATRTLSSIGNYTVARLVGGLALRMIQGLRQLVDWLPHDFHLLDCHDTYLRRELPILLIISRPLSGTSFIEVEDESASEDEVIEWGIAM
ncbi:hypothetical protein BDN71DRAFT_138995 [Pleurotus eryngii]|uniref:Fungal N-terminal domain-containing protein n=1 Tax=Pleurotus eryngii TaxID=5323 RepID=A0A9P6DD21_PLEER|nr:hypothetical protein BDN71DRAFT_138995 [Pleurotus eryngii]